MEQLPLRVQLHERSTFDAFVTGLNAQPMERLRAAADRQQRVALWLWGVAGCGRTHLLQAVCAAAPLGTRLAYLPMKQLGEAAVDFLGGALGTELLCIDDLDSAIGVPAIEHALFVAFRRLEEQGGSMVATASGPPSSFEWTLPDIASRFGAVEIFQLRPLDEQGQHEALQRRALQRGLELPDETARYLLRRVPRDMGTLVRLLDEIDVAALSAQRRLTVPFVRGILGDP